MKLIAQQGIYNTLDVEDISEAAYHADPCLDASLNQSTAKVILAKSLRHAWEQHPRLNPNYTPVESERFDRGTVAHKLVLNRGRDFRVLDYPDWRSGDARKEREAARFIGLVPVLAHQFKEAEWMAAVLEQRLTRFDIGPVFTSSGLSEVVVISLEDTFWLRTMIDWHDRDQQVYYDYKTTEHSLAEQNIPRIINSAGWHIQAAFHERLLDKVDPANAGRRKFRFVAQENFAPFASCIVEMTPAWMVLGRKLVSIAAGRWKGAMKTGTWPAYSTEVIHPELTPWVERDVLDREIDEDHRQAPGPMVTEIG